MVEKKLMAGLPQRNGDGKKALARSDMGSAARLQQSSRQPKMKSKDG
jgi:hypothetical protein